MIPQLHKLTALFRGVKNPSAALLDWLNIKHQPYELRLRDGACMELRPNTGDLFGFYEIMLRRDYVSSGQRLETGMTVIDIGANIGCFSLLASQMVGPTGRVFALEPEIGTYHQLLRNIDLNRVTNITPLQVAVGAQPGKVTLHADSNALFSSIFDSVNGRAIKGVDREVEMTTLEDLMRSQAVSRCDYLKLDCEGAEHAIIEGLPEEVAERIDQITMEIHKIPGNDGRGLQNRLVDLGYRRVGTSTLPFYTRGRA